MPVHVHHNSNVMIDTSSLQQELLKQQTLPQLVSIDTPLNLES